MAVEIIAPSGTATAVSADWTATAQSASNVMEVVANVAVMPTYRGSYQVTPSAQEQVLPTDGLVMDGDLTVGAIPSNYGLITWDGSTITVS